MKYNHNFLVSITSPDLKVNIDNFTNRDTKLVNAPDATMASRYALYLMCACEFGDIYWFSHGCLDENAVVNFIIERVISIPKTDAEVLKKYMKYVEFDESVGIPTGEV